VLGSRNVTRTKKVRRRSEDRGIDKDERRILGSLLGAAAVVYQKPARIALRKR